MADSKKKNDKELSYKELVAKRDELKKEYMDLRFKMVVSHEVVLHLSKKLSYVSLKAKQSQLLKVCNLVGIKGI